ncbi:hypothetical protein NVP1152O_100 [Vibrio phage 1.152.O._10N.222.46.E1]|uniref:Uncharacterized protein n=5 Tax=Nahantvirus 49C7 TaxID=2846601 RepID=A0A2I7RBI1_9CAUD|nr:hypothetical protein HYP57_gp086 [Vibrio phage 1.026.O._10N.222.49.C7]AUR82582.1 hypothetical protein NVP1025O_099 [Vibrio phage 1.025.O._10N.222.46.B6]AUR90832.1 hypothetical protein NVP1150O_099 [Vibrio phage 1.150.O._10N.222.46.A6]AUR91005.1 hypothetical protein NVP1152O_100 [Vibrio phage 1.152.O._10N.222.46.E1]AUS02473.1 hypothetical protein NVP2130O_099 [Vibrio phage 2.130.O._10N.222.46.C2]AUR82690.1 hypothetical protein NVP1026O_099 [Vibrio phage 1.026.O._10N.222.49.C7]
MFPNKHNAVFAKKMCMMSVYQLECEVRVCERQLKLPFLRKDTYDWGPGVGKYHYSHKTRMALVKCIPMWAERILLIEDYLPMAKLMED